jgi:PASTA domain
LQRFSADWRIMDARLAAFVPRFVLLPALALLATATLAFAADRTIAPTAPAPKADTAQSSEPSALVVPDVRGQAYVFAKGTLEDAGFAWRVRGAVQGYAANSVATQDPAPGTRVVDTGAPLVFLVLKRNTSYRQQGTPENQSPYTATELRLADVPAPALKPKPAVRPKPAAKPKPAPKSKPAAKAKPAVKPKHKPAAKPRAVKHRTPDFVVRGAAKEPLDEMPLTTRARMLATWVDAHPKRTRANVRHWLYQHAWIVTGARFGWWHGAEALRTLIDVDRRVQRSWGIGSESIRQARRTLARIEARSR